MGIEVLVGVALAAASAVTGLATANAQADAAKEAAEARKESQEIQTATGQIENRENRRQAVRDERIRRAKILQGAETSGVGSSSGAIGAASGLNTSLGNAVAFQRTGERAAQGIGQANQRAIDADTRGQIAGARGAFFQSIIGGFGSIFE